MISSTSEKTRKSAPRDGKKLRAQLLHIPQVRAVREEILERRGATGSGDVTQDDVDLAARVLISVRERPYPQAIVVVAGGSLGTVGPMFHDWFMRWAYRDADPNSPTLDVPTKISLHVQRLVAQLEAAVRAQIHGVPDPTQALIAAAQLGEQQGLKAQLTAITADRERLSGALAAMTYKVSQLESRVAERAAAELAAHAEFARVTERLHATLEQLREQLAQPAATATATLTRLATQVRQLRAAFAQSSRAVPGRPAAQKARAGNRKPLPKSPKQGRRAAAATGPRQTLSPTLSGLAATAKIMKNSAIHCVPAEE